MSKVEVNTIDTVDNTALTIKQNNTTAITVDTSQNVGIGTTSPDADLHISTGSPEIRLQDTDNTTDYGRIRYNSPSLIFESDDANQTGSSIIRFDIDGSETMRIDSSGVVNVGTTSPVAGATALSADGISGFQNQGNYAININRQTNDGALINFQRGGTTVGNISTQDGVTISIDGGGERAGIVFVSTAWFPRRNGALVDNTLDLGSASYRFDDLFATNGTIQTSDQNEKQSIQSLTSTEIAVAKRISKLFKTFKFNSSVEEKGDNARTHTGVIAQDVQQAFTDEGLDASNYALFISDTWWENEEGDTKEEATEGYTEKTRLGIRYQELLSFISSAFEQRLTNIETRLEALENA